MSALRHVISEAEDIGSSIDDHDDSGENDNDNNNVNHSSNTMIASSVTTTPIVVVVEIDHTEGPLDAHVVARMDVVEHDDDHEEEVVATPNGNTTATVDVPLVAHPLLNQPLIPNHSPPQNNNDTTTMMMRMLDETTYPTSRLLQNDIPPSIQSLQQQYYSSSSLSGDEEEEEEENDSKNNVDHSNGPLNHHHNDTRLVEDPNNFTDESLIQQTSQELPSSRGGLHPPSNHLPPLQTIAPPMVVVAHSAPPSLMMMMRSGTPGGTGGLIRMPSGSASSTQSGGSSSLQARSSQNSSRDWGWFDDVPVAGTTGMTSTIPGSQSGGGGVPMDTKHSHKNYHHRHQNNNNRVTIVDPMMVMNRNSNNNNIDDDDDDNHKMMMNAMAVTAPHYVLEESLSSQFLWKNSAGQRPPQPVEERAFYEKMWAQNFERSNVDYNMPVELLTATSPLSLDPFSDSHMGDTGDYAHHTIGTVSLPMDNSDYHHHAKGTAVTDIAEAALVYRMNDDRNNHHPYTHNVSHPNHNNNDALHNNYHAAPMKREVKDTLGDGTLTVLVRGDNVFGTTVSKSFARTNANGDMIAGGVDTINISIASYRVVESTKHGKFAQFLVIYRQGSIRDTIGIWKRYRDFEELAHIVTQAHEGCVAALANISPLHTVRDNDQETEHLPNAITSWRLLKKRKRWYRCLDAGYLSLKVFLLERFLHDILFESSSPHLLRDFVGVDSVSQML